MHWGWIQAAWGFLLIPVFACFYLRKKSWFVFAFLAAWVFFILALMDPLGKGNYLPFEEKVNRTRVLFLVDTSLSMEVEERLNTAKEIVDMALSELNGFNALWAFTSEPTILSPLTPDQTFLRLVARNLHFNEGDIAGSDLVKALEEVKKSYADQAPPLVVVLTDGEQTVVRQWSGSFSPLILVGIGTNQGGIVPKTNHLSRLDSDFLNTLGEKTGGKVFYVKNESPFSIAKKIVKEAKRHHTVQSIEKEIFYTHYFQYPLFVSLIFLFIFLFYPKKGAALFLIFAAPLWGWQQDAVKYNEATYLLQQGKYKQATLALESLSTPLPSLRYREKLNLAIGLFYLENFPASLSALNEAERAFCKWQEMIGAPKCSVPSVIENLRLALEKRVQPKEEKKFDDLTLEGQLRNLIERLSEGKAVKDQAEKFLASLKTEQEKECDKALWEQVVPPFLEGKKAQESGRVTSALVFWKEALDALVNPPKKKPLSQEFKRSLSEMLLDEKRPAAQIQKGEEKPW